MQKLADTRYPIEPLLKQRWSPRAFADRPVEIEKLLSLWEAGRWSASCANQQPWYLLVATKEEKTEYARLLSCLRENNQLWASQAPVLMVSVAKLSFDMNGQPNRYAFHDVGLAVANLIVQATALGLYVHQMAGFYPDKVRELYGVPDAAVVRTRSDLLREGGFHPDDRTRINAQIRAEVTNLEGTIASERAALGQRSTQSGGIERNLPPVLRRAVDAGGVPVGNSGAAVAPRFSTPGLDLNFRFK